jgi:hypothetical protein
MRGRGMKLKPRAEALGLLTGEHRSPDSEKYTSDIAKWSTKVWKHRPTVVLAKVQLENLRSTIKLDGLALIPLGRRQIDYEQ